MRPLRLSTSPRATLVWARDATQEAEVRQVLAVYGHYAGVTDLLHVVDVEIGVAAAAALDALRSEGFTFQWHPLQRAENRGGWIAEYAGA